MTEREQKQAAKEFAEYWAGKGYEKGQSQPFWMSLLANVLGVTHAEQYISFEDQVMLDHTSFIDGYIEETRVLIEQKSIGKNLKQPIKQSDGSLLNPFQQAKRYIVNLPVSKHPRWVVICNFEEFHIYDMERPMGDPEVIFLKDLPNEYYRLNFLVNTESAHIQKEMEVSLQAGALVGELYDALLKQYKDPTNPASLKSLNMLCVRLVFCLYAEDAGIFGGHGKFHDYLAPIPPAQIRRALQDLFEILDTKAEQRDPYLDGILATFPYVNGGLFADERIEIPHFSEEIKTLLLKNASADFDWSEISPTIFGAVFESTLNPETRRSGGMHYTSIQNIHKVIDPLFLNDLRAELAELKTIKVDKTRIAKLEAFQKKLASLTFLDPACGSGNFLTETYISLRKLENQLLGIRFYDQAVMGFDDVIQVGIGQFYGIEINDFAVTVAKTALWIAESQMMKETEGIVHMDLDFLPLKSYAHIVEGNALRLDWNEVVPKEKLNYIMGNPPFVGFTYMSAEQKSDMAVLFPKVKNLDFVCSWYKLASDFIQNTRIECGFVSTNSITQGEPVSVLWRFLNIKVNFAYQTFKWDNDTTTKGKAAVHCVIVGFGFYDKATKMLFSGDKLQKVSNINAYLLDGPNVIVTSRSKPLYDIPSMIYGNKPADGGNLIIEANDYDEFISKEPQALPFIRPLLGASEYLHSKKRWCLWLKDISPKDLRTMPLVYARVLACKNTREASIAAGIRKFANTPTLFAQITQPEGVPYIIVPRHSSESRKYIPLGFISPQTIVNDAVQIIPEATVYHFGILTSNVHMAWTKTVCGRIKSDYRYSKDVVYNNFPWPNPTDKQRMKIEQTAQAILDARNLYPDSSLADLYDELSMPPELRKAHQQNDKAVMEAYGFIVKETTESTCVAKLMELYQEKINQ